MASKKCPKCGEDNPAEAVMCWACYTPLSGSAPLGAGLAAAATAGAMPKTVGAPIGVPQTQQPAKKGIDPKLIGVGAFLLVGGLAALLMSGLMGGKSGEVVATGVDPTAPIDFAPSIPSGGGRPVAVAPPMLGGGGGGGAPPAPAPLPFKTVASPGGGFKTGTMGILVAGNANMAGAAKFAKDQFASNGRWTNMQVAVFTDPATGDAFAKFQSARKNAPLTNAEFRELADSGVWNNTPVFLDSRGSQERIYYPSRSPQSWWPGR